MDSQALIGREDKTTRIPAVHQSSQMTSHEQEAGVMQTTAILPEQSLSFVQIFLHGAIASVLYTRGLLRHDHPVFSDRCVADLLGADGPVTYKEFLHLNTQAGQMKSQAFKILVKGQSVRANTVLSLLVRFDLTCLMA